MKKIIHKRGECIGCGACVSMCPGFFETDKEDGLASLKNSVQVDDHFELVVDDIGCAEDCAMICPVKVIKIAESE